MACGGNWACKSKPVVIAPSFREYLLIEDLILSPC